MSKRLSSENPRNESVIDINTRRHQKTSSEHPDNVVRMPPATDVIAAIHIELRRGGQVKHRMDGVTRSNAYRFTSVLMSILADTIRLIGSRR